LTSTVTLLFVILVERSSTLSVTSLFTSMYSSSPFTCELIMAEAIVSLIPPSLSTPMTLISSPTAGSAFLMRSEFNSPSVCSTSFSVSLSGAYPTAKLVSLARGTPLAELKFFTRSALPGLIMVSILISFSGSRNLNDFFSQPFVTS
jgi:hypothetical protein